MVSLTAKPLARTVTSAGRVWQLVSWPSSVSEPCVPPALIMTSMPEPRTMVSPSNGGLNRPDSSTTVSAGNPVSVTCQTYGFAPVHQL